jgi:hypothetical protein
MKGLARAFGRSIDFVMIGAMIVTVLSVLIQFGLKPVGGLFHVTFYVSLIVVAIMTIVKVITNFKEIEKDRLAFLITNIVSGVVLGVMIVGLHFNYFENQTPAVVMNYVSMALYFFTSLCLL